MANIMNLETISYALMGGVLPALVWLSFWLQEDYRHPEPRKLLLKTFLFGMVAVFLVIPFQKVVQIFSPDITMATLVVWAVFEEVAKFVAAYFGGLKSIEDNEPLDPLVYMITAALGFVALENALFLVGPLIGDNQILENYIVTGNLRFIGASLLHIVCSGIVGAALAFSFYKNRVAHHKAILIGIIGAMVVHAAFNTLIIFWGGKGMLIAFAGIWVGVLILLLLFEKVKTIARASEEGI